MSEKKMLLLPTFDGQTRGVAAIALGSIDLIKPSMTPGMTTLFLTGDHANNFIGVEMEMPVLIEKLKEAGLALTDLSGGRKMERGARRDDGH